LERYLVEVVETYQLCPWARGARQGGELAVEVVLGVPTLDAWTAAIDRAFASTQTRIAMIVAPELVIDIPDLRELRDRCTAARPGYGIAEFHPTAELDLGSPGRLVRFLRRSPDPLLQLVPLSLLHSVHATELPDRAQQAQILLGVEVPPARDVGAQIAQANHATVAAHHVMIEAVLAEIARDRDASYARVGISACR